MLDRYKVAVVDEDDNELPVGESGELVIRPLEPAIMAVSYTHLTLPTPPYV